MTVSLDKFYLIYQILNYKPLNPLQKSIMPRDNRLIYLLTKAQHRLVNYLKKELLAENIKVTSVQSGILFLLKQRPHTMTELSRELAIDNSAITGMVDRLERVDFASRERHPSDRRTFLITITAKGLEEINKAKLTIRKVNDQIKEGFSEEEVEIFKRVLNGVLTKFENEPLNQRLP